MRALSCLVLVQLCSALQPHLTRGTGYNHQQTPDEGYSHQLNYGLGYNNQVILAGYWGGGGGGRLLQILTNPYICASSTASPYFNNANVKCVKCHFASLKGTVSWDFRHIFIKKLHLDPVWRARQKRFREIFRFHKIFAKNMCPRSRWLCWHSADTCRNSRWLPEHDVGVVNNYCTGTQCRRSQWLRWHYKGFSQILTKKRFLGVFTYPTATVYKDENLRI